MCLLKDNKFLQNPLYWQQTYAFKPGKNTIKVEVRAGNTMIYYVNDSKIGIVRNDAGFDYKFYGLVVTGNQGICFNMLRIYKHDDN